MIFILTDGWWRKIQKIADGIVDDYIAGKLKFQLANKQLSAYTLIKPMTIEEYENRQPSLKGGGGLLPVVRRLGK